MNRNKRITISLLLVVGFSFLGICLLIKNTFCFRKRVKPEIIPDEAIWIGGVDGGCYCQLCSDYFDTCHFVIYNEFTGNIWYDGLFVCSKEDFECIADKDWRKLILNYDGVNIYMKTPYDKKYNIVWYPIE